MNIIIPFYTIVKMSTGEREKGDRMRDTDREIDRWIDKEKSYTGKLGMLQNRYSHWTTKKQNSLLFYIFVLDKTNMNLCIRKKGSQKKAYLKHLAIIIYSCTNKKYLRNCMNSCEKFCKWMYVIYVLGFCNQCTWGKFQKDTHPHPPSPHTHTNINKFTFHY